MRLGVTVRILETFSTYVGVLAVLLYLQLMARTCRILLGS